MKKEENEQKPTLITLKILWFLCQTHDFFFGGDRRGRQNIFSMLSISNTISAQ